MSHVDETFFTTIGCMDGRVQSPIAKYGQNLFRAIFPDTITEAGLVGLLSNNPSRDLLDSIKNKIVISAEKHHSLGIIVHGHSECAGNPVDDEVHREDVRKSVQIIKQMINNKVPVLGVFVKRSDQNLKKWVVEEL